MIDRSTLSRNFIEAAGWGAAQRTVLAGDASNRRYDRLTDKKTGGTVVLMDAPPEKGEDVRPFVRIAKYLNSLGLSAPQILAEDTSAGFLLLEDLGDDLFARVIPEQRGPEQALYETATDLLVALHNNAAPAELDHYSPPVMSDLAALALDWYLPGATDQPAADDTRATFCAELETVLTQHAPDDTVLIQRDYHAENLLWLPARDGVARVGLLDFQDAMAGHPAYDLVSLLEDARRDVPPSIQAAMVARYIAATGCDSAAFNAAYSVLGAQRNLRILGVFARLCIRDGKPNYTDLLPRVWNHLQRDLSHPALSGVKEQVDQLLPHPTPEICQRIKDRCKTNPMR
ncbi:aminoglycoside phosphotransferase family protein [Actibacterium lipolyticum]|uniref:Phosphotransferase enzyme family protein n=1 Tax=Actibacterium lipolyticum TaxID=1524263 RepID=A0A238KYN4_9RHOB|nr:phosphotransferase [Actibacterium lipolyticum]SMX47156.1 Phosphotransferase enzyme family protein [Actibacterium lipolyticum]